MNRKTALVLAAILLLATAPSFLHVVSAAPQPAAFPKVLKAAQSTSQSFAASCLSNELADIRPDPAWVASSYESDHCVAPQMPLPPDGASAKREQIVAAMAAVKRYGVQSDQFQRCITDYLAERRSVAARTGKPVPAWLPVIENHRILASEKNKERGAALMRSAIVAFNEYGSDCPG